MADEDISLNEDQLLESLDDGNNGDAEFLNEVSYATKKKPFYEKNRNNFGNLMLNIMTNASVIRGNLKSFSSDIAKNKMATTNTSALKQS